MKLVLSHGTAFDLLRAYRCGAPFQLTRTRATSLNNSAHTKSAVRQFEIPCFPRIDERLHVLVGDRTALSRSNGHVCHLATSPLPEGALLQVTADVFVTSPELLFLQLAAQLPWLDIALIGLELCGSYSLLPADAPAMQPSAPITQAASLSNLIAKMPQARSAEKARWASNVIADFSASPLESALYLLITLPVKRGGYGLPKPDLNPSTALGRRNAFKTGIDDLHCDIHWTEAHVALEYNSKDHHVGHLTRDALRTNMLTSEGEHVFTMTPAILANPAECDFLVSQIARMLNHRLRGNALGTSPRRLALRSQLFPWA